jgi:hypothetical protein
MGIPGIIAWFIQHRVSPFSCFGAFPDTLGRLLDIKAVPDKDRFLQELNDFLAARANL